MAPDPISREDALGRWLDTLGTGPEQDFDLSSALDGHGLVHEAAEFEAAAAATMLAFGSATDLEPLPIGLRARCLGAADGFRAAQGDAATVPAATAATPPSQEPLRFTRPTPQHGDGSLLGRLGWLAAAACLALVVAAWWPGSDSDAASPASARRALLGDADDAVMWDWAPWDESFEGVTGDVVWSESRQEGYLRLVGLPANEPTQEQYQLWIVESSRGVPLETAPVDGGVFNVTGTTDEVIIPIRAKLESQDVVAFAVTREPPGGVVVSDRQRRVVIATPKEPA